MTVDALPPAPTDAPFGAYVWVDWYQKVRTAINNATIVQWSAITGTPTTVGGYGITDAVKVAASSVTLPAGVGDGSSAGTGTLNNAPVSGNPTKWLQFDDNGTIRYVPAW